MKQNCDRVAVGKLEVTCLYATEVSVPVGGITPHILNFSIRCR
jgi:hypothetical protein